MNEEKKSVLIAENDRAVLDALSLKDWVDIIFTLKSVALPPSNKIFLPVWVAKECEVVTKKFFESAIDIFVIMQ